MQRNQIDIVIRAFDQASTVLSGVRSQIESLNMVATKFQTTGFGMMIAGGLAIAPMVKAIQIYSEFEDQLRNVVAITQEFDDVTASVEKYGNAILDVAGKTRFFTTQIAEAAYAMGSRGFRYEEIAEMLFPSAILAQAIHAPLEETTELFLNTIQQFNIATNQLPNVGDMIAKSIADSPLTMERLAKAMKYVGSEAYTANESIGDVLASLMVLAKQGIYGEKAGTAFRRILQSLIAPTREAEKALGELGLTVEDVSLGTKSMGDVIALFQKRFQELGWATIDPITGKFTILANEAHKVGGVLRDIFQIRAAGRFKAMLVEGADAWEDYAVALNKSTGLMEEMSTIQNESLIGTWRIFLSNLRAFAIEVSEQKSGALKDFIASLHRLVTTLREADPAIKKFLGSLSLFGGSFLIVGGAISLIVGTLMKFGIAIVHTVAAIGKLAVALKALGMFFVSNPIGIGILAIVGTIAALVIAFNRVEQSAQKEVQSIESASSALRKMRTDTAAAAVEAEQLNDSLGKMDEYDMGDLDSIDLPAVGTTTFTSSYNEAFDTLRNRFTWLGDSVTSDYSQSTFAITDLTNVAMSESSKLISSVQNEFARSRIYATSETAAWAAAIEKNLGGATDAVAEEFDNLRNRIIEALDLERFGIQIEADFVGPENEITPILDDITDSANKTSEAIGGIGDKLNRSSSLVNAGIENWNNALRTTLTTAAETRHEIGLINDEMSKSDRINLGNLFSESSQRISDLIYKTQSGRSAISEVAKGIQDEFRNLGLPTPELGSIISDLTAGMSVLESKGYSTVEALIAVERIFTALLNPSAEARDIFDTMGFSMSDATNKSSILGHALTLINAQLDDSNKLIHVFEDQSILTAFEELGMSAESFGVAADRARALEAALRKLEELHGIWEIPFKMDPKIEILTTDSAMIQELLIQNSEELNRKLDAVDLPLLDFKKIVSYMLTPEFEIGIPELLNEFQAYREANNTIIGFKADLGDKLDTMLKDAGLDQHEFVALLKLIFTPIPESAENLDEYIDTYLDSMIISTAGVSKDLDIALIPNVDEKTFSDNIKKIVADKKYNLPIEALPQLIGAYNLAQNEKFGLFSEEFEKALENLGMSVYDFLQLLKDAGGFELEIIKPSDTNISKAVEDVKQEFAKGLANIEGSITVKAQTIDVTSAEVVGELPAIKLLPEKITENNERLAQVAEALNRTNESLATFEPVVNTKVEETVGPSGLLAEVNDKYGSFVSNLSELNKNLEGLDLRVEANPIKEPEPPRIELKEYINIDSINFNSYKYKTDEEIAQAIVQRMRIARAKNNGLGA